MYWIDLAQNGDKWWDVVVTVMNIRFNKIHVICRVEKMNDYFSKLYQLSVLRNWDEVCSL